MFIRALHDIWDAFRMYNDQALRFGVYAIIIYTSFSLIRKVARKVRGEQSQPIGQILFQICVFALLGIYFSYVISLTLSGREAGSRSGYVNLILFSTLGNGESWKLTGIENILLFLPYGVLVPMIWKVYRRFWNLGLLAFITSTSIELLQLITRRGFFELDDIVLNTAGAVIGYLGFALFYYSFRALTHRVKEKDDGKINSSLVAMFQLLPILIMIIVIFSFSSEDGMESGTVSASLTEKMVVCVDRIFSLDMTNTEIDETVVDLEKGIRKAAHMVEYALLAMFTVIFLYCRKMHLFPAILAAELFVLLIGACDEWNQSHIEGRFGSPMDVLIDGCGAAILLAVFWIIMHHKEKRCRIES